MVTIGDNRDYIRVLLYSYYTTITGWGVLLIYTLRVQVHNNHILNHNYYYPNPKYLIIRYIDP